ncbi:MAG TPA: metallophosphoesterase family protein [Paucimonas sp.]|nr:metallophosphoesterase family protein [Paucimonas sp.]HJW57485.1 metallophosphoesterase family protein [Burkholderiaceae bacterium]
MLIGVISDTHGLLRPQALAALADAAHIIHAGDIGNAEILQQLARIAPVTAIRGNNDTYAWATAIPETQCISIGGTALYVLHDIKALDIDPVAGGVTAVIFGHSHQPSIEMRDGVLFLNPGSAGPRRFHLPVSVARLEIADGTADAEILELEIDPA